MNNHIFIYSLLTSLFATAIVTANLVFQKYVYFSFLGLLDFEISVGTLLYPITFVISDLITEFYGKQFATKTVQTGIIVSIIIMLIIMICEFLPATSWSKIDNKVFSQVFGVFHLAFFASLLACFLGQITDIRIFLIIKKLTGERFLWLRSNLSTFTGQLIDNICVQSILLYFAIIPQQKFWLIFWDNLLFKCLIAVCSTPIFYLGYFIIKKYDQNKMA